MNFEVKEINPLEEQVKNLETRVIHLESTVERLNNYLQIINYREHEKDILLNQGSTS